MIGLLILLKSPTIVIAGFIPLFFDNAVIAVYANNRGGFKAACLFPFLSGIIQVGGSALFATWIGMSTYGGYIGMFDWATAWPLFTVVMKVPRLCWNRRSRHWSIGYSAVTISEKS